MVVKGERMAAWTLLVLSACILIPSPRTLRAETWSCSGTRLKLSVQERGRSAVERFRFFLAVSGEGADEATALQQLNPRLTSVRRELKPLVQGQLVVPAPHTHQRGRASEQRYVANSDVSGHVSLGSYDRLFQALGAMP